MPRPYGKQIALVTGGFGGILSGADDDVQKAMETLDDLDHGDIAGLGDDDHPQYGLLGSAEAVTGAWDFQAALVVSEGNLHVGANDATQGVLNLYGPAAGNSGGRINLYASDAYDTLSDYWAILVYQTGVRFIGCDGNTVWMELAGPSGAPCSGGSVQINKQLTMNALLVMNGFDLDMNSQNILRAAGIGIGTSSIPHGGVGAALLALDGAAGSSAGPHVQFTVDTDNYPLLQVLPWAHDNVQIVFDAYRDAAQWRSSDDSNFRVHKSGDQLRFGYDSGIAAGNLLTWNIAAFFDTSGNLNCNQNIAMVASKTVDGRDVSADGAWLDTLYTTIGLKDLTSAEVDQLENIGATTISAGQWGYLGAMDQGVATGDSVTFNAITATSIIIGANTLDTNEWAFLDGQDQALKIADSPTFANLYVPDGGSMGINMNERFVFDAAGLISVADAHLVLTSTNQVQFAGPNEYINSGAAGYLDDHFSDDDKGRRLYSGANLLATFVRYSAGNPSRFTIRTTGSTYFFTDGVQRLDIGGAIKFHGHHYMNTDNLKSFYGGGFDAALYYDATNFIIDPDVVGAGKVYIGVTADDDLCAGNICIGGTTVNANLTLVGDAMLGDGGTTDYAAFAADGELTLAGTARVTKSLGFTGAHLERGATAPSEVPVGDYTTWEYGIGDDSIIDAFKIPDAWAVGTDLIVSIDYQINEAYAANNGEVRFQTTWSATPDNETEAIDAPTHSGTLTSADDDIPATARYFASLTIGTISGGSLSAGDEIGLTLSRIALADGSNPTVEPGVVHVHVRYVKDKLGAAT